MPFKDPTSQRARQSAASAQARYRRGLKELGLCRCRQPAVQGKTLCEACNRKNNDFTLRRQKEVAEVRLAMGIRARMNRALGAGYKAGSAVRDLGCTIPELRAHLEKLFQPGMTWENWTKTGWHIDHIKPLSSFNLTDRSQFMKACHYTNLQPLWAEENLKKGDRHDAAA